MESKVGLSISHFSKSKNLSTISHRNTAFTCLCLYPFQTETLNSHLQQIERSIIFQYRSKKEVT